MTNIDKKTYGTIVYSSTGNDWAVCDCIDNVICDCDDTNDTQYTEPSKLQMAGELFKSTFSKSYFRRKWHTMPVRLRLHTTSKCNENCAHCFECAGPNHPLNILSPDDAGFYAHQAHYKDITITGGEWSLIYDVNDNYLLDLFEKIPVDNTDTLTIQTNCRWMFGPHKNKILSDIHKIQHEMGQHGKILKLDTSVDKYHSQASLRGVQELIAHIATHNFPNTKIRILSLAEDYKMANDKILCPEFFEPRGVQLKFQPRDVIMYPLFQVCYANNTRIVIHEENVVLCTGRAAEKQFGYKIFFPETQCGGFATHANHYQYMELSVCENGTIKWSDLYNQNIQTTYHNESGNCKSLVQIKDELIKQIWKKLFIKNTLQLVSIFTPGLNIYAAIRYRRNRQQAIQSYDQYISPAARNIVLIAKAR